jgi:glutaredoxin|tara:strand:- start:2783 stop:3070 length:288 start_codon:yes stop_codon:yes gene_type:complete
MHGNLEPEERVFGTSITVYSTEGCFYCEQMKLLMNRAKLSFNEIKIGDRERDAFAEKYPDAKGYPYVIMDGEPIGGLVETAKVLLKKGLISGKEK